MRFPIMLTKENDKKVNELNNKIVEWIRRFDNMLDERDDYREKYIITKASLKESNKANKELKGKIKELERQLGNKDKGIEVMKKMIEERTTDNE